MNRRREVLHIIDADMRQFGHTMYGDRIRRIGVAREADMELLMDAARTLGHGNLSLVRWRTAPEVKEAIRAAREAVDAAIRAASPYVYPRDDA